MLGWIVSGVACVEQWGRTNILAQASSSRLSENSRCSPRVLPRALAQASSSRFERHSVSLKREGLAKRELVKSHRGHYCSLA